MLPVDVTSAVKRALQNIYYKKGMLGLIELRTIGLSETEFLIEQFARHKFSKDFYSWTQPSKFSASLKYVRYKCHKDGD